MLWDAKSQLHWARAIAPGTLINCGQFIRDSSETIELSNTTCRKPSLASYFLSDGRAMGPINPPDRRAHLDPDKTGLRPYSELALLVGDNRIEPIGD